MKICLKRMREFVFNNIGLTILEVLAILVILSIVAIMAIPTIHTSIEKVNLEVCHTNRVSLERSYVMYLTLENKTHCDALFSTHKREFNDDICPEDGEIHLEMEK